MRIFKVKLEWKDMEDSWYFKNPPSKEDILKGILDHKKRAGIEWNDLYDAFTLMLNEIPFNDTRPTHTSRLVHSGGPCKYGTYTFSAHALIEN